MLYSSSTHEAGIEAEIVAAGLGRQGDFAGAEVEGKIALIERGEIFFSDKVANAAAVGAAAVVLYNNQPGPPTVGTLRGPSKRTALIWNAWIAIWLPSSDANTSCPSPVRSRW